LENGGGFLLVTQNVDGLHLRAGSKNTIEIHGSLLFSRCLEVFDKFYEGEAGKALPEILF